MRIRWHGHACFEFKTDSIAVIVDPHDGKSIGIKPPAVSADIVLMTHDHYDHNAARLIRGSHDDFKFALGKHTCKGFDFEGFECFHDEFEGSKRGVDTIYKFTMDDIVVCHCGDIGAIPSDAVIDSIAGCDILFVPVGEIYTMSIEEVKEFVTRVGPKIVVPMHYRVGGLSLPLATVDKFLGIIPEDNVNYVGNEADLSADELPERGECWVFSPQ
jgi:L-ascorbate metabolism protein UlaG (beta-lactamase superfamily)